MMKRILKFLIALGYKIRYFGTCRIFASSDILLGRCRFEGKNAVGKNCYLKNTELGYGSYLGSHCYFPGTRIGRFCSISSYVTVVAGTHPLNNRVSTHPAFYSDSYRQLSYTKHSGAEELLSTVDGFACRVGNDVWIGQNVMIRGGVTIGDGAVIGMGSVVVKDVPPYAIVAGVPARVIRNRFDEETAARLEKMRWWDRPLEWIEAHAANFEDVAVLFASVMEEENRENL